MKQFFCACGQRLTFDNVQCLACGRRLAFAPERLAMVALEGGPGDSWTMLGDPMRAPRRLCTNYAQAGICNWLAPPPAEAAYCASCALTRAIPDLGVDGNLARWARIEAAKRRLVYGLLALRLPLQGDGGDGLCFSFLADLPGLRVVTGHENGHITLSIAEADDVTRAQTRELLGEPYRTLLGHLRHESGHYYWVQLVGGHGHAAHASFRALFGDETSDYAAALERHYRDGAPADWSTTFVSAYASAHPHEDWAETWAHYLHIRDTLETARTHGLSVGNTDLPPDAVDTQWAFKDLVAAWLPVTLAVNELNRSMGQPDMYPFVLPPAALEKLEFVHDLVVNAGGTARA